MASQKKRRRTFESKNNGNEEMSSSSEELEGSDDEDRNFLNQDVEVEFEARTPDVKDEQGIKRLLHQLFLKANINLTDLTRLILEQDYVGSVLKQSDMAQDSDDDDDDVFGFISVINIMEQKNRESIQQLRHFLLTKCEETSDDDTVKRIKLLLDGDSQIGFIFSERFVNIPPKIAVPFYETLKKEIDEVVRKNLRFKFDRYFLISKIYKPLKSPKNDRAESDVVYSNAEEVFLENEVELSFDYSVLQEKDAAMNGRWDGDEDIALEPCRRLLVFTADKLASFIERIKVNFMYE